MGFTCVTWIFGLCGDDLILDDMNQMQFPAISDHSIIKSAFYFLVNEEQIN